MKKLAVILVLSVGLVVGCSNVSVDVDNELEESKLAYLDIKDELDEVRVFDNIEDVNFDVTVSVDRINEEEVSYRAIIDNPKENMYNVKALLIHNNFTENVFPSIGIFDETMDLIVGNEEVKGFALVGYLETEKNISELDLELRLYVSYTNDLGEEKEINLRFSDLVENDSTDILE